MFRARGAKNHLTLAGRSTNSITDGHEKTLLIVAEQPLRREHDATGAVEVSLAKLARERFRKRATLKPTAEH